MWRRWLGGPRPEPVTAVPDAPADALAPTDAPSADEAREIEKARVDVGLERTRQGLLGRLAAVFGPTDITDETWDDLEAMLIQSDVGTAASADLVARARRLARDRGVRRAVELDGVLRDAIVDVLAAAQAPEPAAEDRARPGRAARPYVILVVGVNGSGKTTSIAKLAAWHVAAGDRVLLVAGDTFRAAATEQLVAWGERLGISVATGQHGADPGAVVFDALASRLGQSADVAIVDTAGRLHTQQNLMSELVKVRGVVSRVVPGAPHETLLVLDATTGQNGIAQARAFTAAVDVTGIVLAKLDSSSRGGVALAVAKELGIPILYVGTGESTSDMAAFDAVAYAEGLLGRGADAAGP